VDGTQSRSARRPGRELLEELADDVLMGAADAALRMIRRGMAAGSRV
jgi:hypothetical protein